MKKNKNSGRKLKKDTNSSINVPGSSNVECDVKTVDSVDKVNVPVGQSTPKRLDALTHQDSLNLDYHSSLCCTQTQDGGIEVTWDWHSPGRKAIESNGKNITANESFSGGTPKRSTSIHKKRISNSPLMYKPLKRKLIKTENTDDIDKFKAELIALSEKIKNAREDEKCSTNESGDIAKIDIPREVEFDDSTDDEAKFITGVNNEGIKSAVNVEITENKDFDDFFDDSLNDTMIRCSQEIEQRLNIVPVNALEEKGSGNFTNSKGKNYLTYETSKYQFMDTNEDKPNKIMETKKLNVNNVSKWDSFNSQNFTVKSTKLRSIIPNTPLQRAKSSEVLMKTGQNSSNTKTKTCQQESTSVSKNKNFHTDLNEIDDLKIPDDSFDEFLVSCDDDFSQPDNNFSSTNSSRYGKVYDSAHSISPMKSKTASIITKNNILNNNMRVNNEKDKLTIQSSKTSITSLQSTSTTDRHWKFFKSKSYSDSNFTSNSGKNTNPNTKSANQISFQNAFKNGSNSNLNLKTGSKVSSGPSVSTEQQIPPIRRTTSCLDSNAVTKKSQSQINIHNTQIYNVNRSVEKEDGNDAYNKGKNQSSGDVSSSIQSLQLCGPEEIAKKRMEAKMKLEAKKNRQKLKPGVNMLGMPSTTRNKR